MGLTKPDIAALEALSPQALAQIPGEAPPNSVIPNFAHPKSNDQLILGLSYFFFAGALICFSLRIWTRAFYMKRWQWDDVTLSLGFMMAIVHLVFVTRGVLFGGCGKHQWEIHMDTMISDPALQQDYVTVIMVSPALGLIKMSLLIQYYMLFNMRRYIRVCVWVAVLVFGLFYVSLSITAFVLNSPWHGDSLLETVVSRHYLKFAEFAIPTGAIGVAFDWFLLILPIPAVWSLHLTLGKKIGIMVIFATGGMAAIASAVCLYYRVQIQKDLSDVTWKVGYVLLWTHVELFAGVAAASMPAVRQFCSHQERLKSWGSSLKRSIVRSSSHGSSNQDRLPAHVATLREYESKTTESKEENPRNVDIEAGDGAHALPRDSASTLGKDDASASLKSVSTGSYRL